MVESSLFVAFCAKIAGWFSGQFQKSRLIAFFLTQNDREATAQNSIFNRVFYGIVHFFQAVFKALRLDRLFSGSIYKVPFIWCFFTVFAAPFLPTMLVLLMAVATFASLALSLICDKGKKLRYFAINKYIYMYAGVYLFAIFTSVSRRGSLLGGLLTICFMLFFIVVINAVETKQQLRFLMFFFVCAGILVALYGFYQFMFPAKYSGVWVDTDMFQDIRFRVYSTLENPNVLGEYFLLVIPVAFACFLNSEKMILKLFYLGATGIMMLCLILTYSRGCYIGILVAMGMFLVLLDRRFILLGILGLLLLPFVLPDTIINRFMSIGNMQDSSTSYRVYIYMGTIAMLKDYWLCGIGPGTDAFNQVYPAYAYNSISAPHSHNLFLQVMCDAGICGIFVFVAIIYQYYKAAFASLTRERDKKNRTLIIAGISAISGFMVQSLFDYTFYNYRVMLLFWIALAFGILFTDIPSLGEERKKV